MRADDNDDDDYFVPQVRLPEVLTRPDDLLDGLEAEARLVFTTRNGRRIAWRTWGAGDPVLLLHGGAGSWRHWVRNIRDLAATHLVIAPDLPGLGDSDDAGFPVDFLEMAREVGEGLDEVLGEPLPYVIAAFSYGGQMTSLLLHTQPGRQRAVVLVSPAGVASPNPPQLMTVRGKHGDELTEAHRHNLAAIMIGDPAKIDDLSLRLQHENSSRSRIRTARVDRGPSLLETLPDFGGPVLALWGDLDGFLDEELLRTRIVAFKEACPQAEVQVLKGVGHWIMYEDAPTFDAALRGVLDGLEETK